MELVIKIYLPYEGTQERNYLMPYIVSRDSIPGENDSK